MIRKYSTPVHFGIIDSESGRLLILSRDFFLIQRLQEMVQNSTAIDIQPKNRFDLYTYDFLRFGLFHYMKWDSFQQEFTLLTRNIPPEIISKSKLTVAKAEVLKRIFVLLEEMRSRVKKAYFYQDCVYTRKGFEAQRFKDRGYPEHEVLEYPYLLEYADQAKLSLREAADLILFKSSVANETLAKTETFRIRFLNELCQAQTIEQIRNISEEIKLYRPKSM